MGREITIPGFVNYTDCRQNNGVCEIATDRIKDYARSLSEEEMKLFLEEVADDMLISVIYGRMINRKNKIEAIERYLQ